MKTVAIICQVEKKHVEGKIGGGIMSVERSHADLLSNIGYQVHFITTKDSDDIWANNPNITTAKLCSECEEFHEAAGDSTKQSRGKINKQRTSAIREYILDINPDVIINHSFSSSHLKLCVELSDRYPVLTFLHCMPEAAADMGMFAKLQSYRTLTENGSELVCVSYYQRSRWTMMLMRRILSGSEYFEFLRPDLDGVPAVQAIFNRICYSTAISNKYDVKPAEDYYVVIGRPEKDKNIGRFLKGLYDLKKFGVEPKVKIFMAFAGKLEDYEHYNERMAEHLPNLPNVELFNNKDRVTLLTALSGSKALIVTSDETSPVAVIEAMTYGVPSIVFCRKDPDGTLHHACFDVMNYPAEQTMIPVSVDRKIFIDELKKAFEDTSLESIQIRERIRDYALTRHSRDARIQELDGAIKDVIFRYKDNVSGVRSLLTFE
jgi:glycosyltransferase involved in cell wall biosynthesis